MVEVDRPNRYGGLQLQEDSPLMSGDVINNQTLSENPESTIRFVDKRGVYQEISSKWLDPDSDKYQLLQKHLKEKYGDSRVSQNTVFQEAFALQSKEDLDDWF